VYQLPSELKNNNTTMFKQQVQRSLQHVKTTPSSTQYDPKKTPYNIKVSLIFSNNYTLIFAIDILIIIIITSAAILFVFAIEYKSLKIKKGTMTNG